MRVEVFAGLFAQVADQFDVVTVSTPDHMHFPIAVEAIKYGKPVMVQKPLCNNLWEARALSEYAARKGVLTVMASFNSWNGDKCHGHRYLLTDVTKHAVSRPRPYTWLEEYTRKPKWLGGRREHGEPLTTFTGLSRALAPAEG